MIKKAQSMLEYGVLFGVICAALVLMSIYLKRGICGRIKQQADTLGTQYDPYTSQLNSTYESVSSVFTNVYTDNITIGENTYFGLVSNEYTNENVTQTVNQRIAK